MLRLQLLASFSSLLFVCSPLMGQEQSTIYLERKPVSLRSPDKFQIPISLDAKLEVTLTANSSGPVQSLLCEVGKASTSQAELIRLDSEEHRLLVDRAKAALDLAKAAEESPTKKAAVEVATLDLQLAQLRLERTKTVAPFDGTVRAIHVVEGEFVRAAAPLVTLFDDSVVTARVPVERTTAKVGETVALTIEGQPYDATIQAVLPIDAEFEPLRDLFESLATAVVEIDNGTGSLTVGQTVRSDMIPRDPITEVPNGAVLNNETGDRQVFVLRDGVARAIPVQVLSTVGQTDSFVAGEFSDADELVVSGADQLVDGQRVVPAAEAPVVASEGGQGTQQAGRPGKTNQPRAQSPTAPTGGF